MPAYMNTQCMSISVHTCTWPHKHIHIPQIHMHADTNLNVGERDEEELRRLPVGPGITFFDMVLNSDS